MSTPHFTDSELRCRCGCEGLPPEGFQQELEILRVEYGRPIRLSSAYRCPEYNERVSNTGSSGPHTLGAVDCLVFGGDVGRLIDCAIGLHWTGFGISQKGPHESRFVHLDRLANEPGRPRPWWWSY